MIGNLLIPPLRGPSPLVSETVDKTASPSDLRMGIVSEVTTRGITVACSSGAVQAAHLGSYAPAVGDSVALMKTQDSWLALGRVVGSGTATDNLSGGSSAGVTVLAAMHTEDTATLASSTGSTVAVPRYSLTFYHPANHAVLILAGFVWLSTVSADWIIADLKENVSGSAVGEFVQPIVSNSFGRFDTMSGLARPSLGGTTRTYSMTMARLAGTGTTTIQTSSSRCGYMIALDLGDASLIPTT